jgi:hypothetical protein
MLQHINKIHHGSSDFKVNNSVGALTEGVEDLEFKKIKNQ